MIPRARPLLALLALLTLASAGCVEPRSPAPAPDGPALALFDATVVPVLEARCVGCHAVDPDAWQATAAAPESGPHRYVVDASGRLATADQRRFAREVLLRYVDPTAPPLASPVARVPLASVWSGGAHAEVFSGPEHPELRALLTWIEAEVAALPPSTRQPPPASPAAQIFADEVTPILARKGCFGGNCHGPRAFNDLRLDPGLPALADRFTPAIHAANRQAMLGANTRLTHLSGDVERSKQLLKNIPLVDGGVVHRGGNGFLRRGDPDYQVLVRWLELEAAELRERTGAQLGVDGGLVFVRRPRHTPERFLEDVAFHPGARLVHLVGTSESDLTEALPFEGPVDLRAPEVSYDARRVVLPVRPSADAAFDLWEIDLASRAARQLTFSSSPREHYHDPLWVPAASDPEGVDLSAVDLVFVSSRAGGVSPSSPPGGADPQRLTPRYDAWRMPHGDAGREREAFAQARRMTFTVDHVRRPTMRSSGEVMFTALRQGWQAGRPFFNGALFRTHIEGSDFHTHNGNRSAVPLHTDDRELPSGLEVRIGRDADSWWGGALLLSDHQFGPTIEGDELSPDHAPDSSLPGFVPGWISLDESVRPGGVSPGGVWRDPHPAPDGTLLVSWAPGPIDLSDPGADPDFDVLRLTPAPSWQADGGFSAGAFNRVTVVSGPDAEVWPRPVSPRAKEHVRKRLKPDTALFGPPVERDGLREYADGTPATLVVLDVPLLDAFFRGAAPAGPRPLADARDPDAAPTPELDRVVGLRVVGALGYDLEADAPELRRVVLAEGPIEPDGSFYAAIPSGVAFDMQSLNPLGMALRAPNRWLYAHPGERHALSIPRALFGQTCGGCHGSLTGRPADVVGHVDVVSGASRTLATRAATSGDPRQPTGWRSGRVTPPTGVDFERDLRPVLERRCVGCHDGPPLDLRGAAAFEALRAHVDHRDGRAIRSYLMEKLLGRELDAPRRLEGGTPHDLPASELRAFMVWIDLGATRRGEGSP